MKFSDAPITKIEDDTLGRGDFARRLGQRLANWEEEDSIVVGLYAGWGQGKTSLMNMVIEQIEVHSDDPKPIIVRFNPWYFNDTDELLHAFFIQLFSELASRTDKAKDWFANRLYNYGALLKKARGTAVIGGSMAAFGDILGFLSDNKQSLSEAKTELDKRFRELGQKVLVVIDDIDRLPDTQIRQILQLVKLNANFPNTIYLLLADHDVVEQALGKGTQAFGRSYLEKIVQLSFNLPPIEREYIGVFLVQEIERVLSENKLALSVEEHNDLFGSMFVALPLQPSKFFDFFSNLRDIKRYINGLSFNLPLVASEVNPRDFIIIEAFRIFVPDLYRHISTNPEFFLRSSRYKISLPHNIHFFKPKYEVICKNLVDLLFPQKTDQSKHPKVLYQEKRICSPLNFSAYFLLRSPLSTLSHEEITEILSLSHSLASLKMTIAKFEAYSILNFFRHFIIFFVDDIPIEALQNLFILYIEFEKDDQYSIEEFFVNQHPFERKYYQRLTKLSFHERNHFLKKYNHIINHFPNQIKQDVLNILTSMEEEE